MTQGTISPTVVSDEHIEYGHVFANYVKSTADTPADTDPYPDIALVSGQVTFTATFPGSAARGSLRLPLNPRSYGLIVTGDTFEIVNSKLIDHEGRDGVWLVAAVDEVPLSWQAVVTLQDSAGRTIYNRSYIIHHDLWLDAEDGLEIDLPDLIPTPSRLEPPEGAAVRLAERAIEEIKLLTESNQQINLDVKGLKSDIVAMHGQTGQDVTAAEAARAAAVVARNEANQFRGEAGQFRGQALEYRNSARTARDKSGEFRDEASDFRDEAEGFRDDSLANRNAARQSETNASDSAEAADKSESNAAESEDEAEEHARRAGVERNFAEQVSLLIFNKAIEVEEDIDEHALYLDQWWADFEQLLEDDFTQEYNRLTNLRDEMSNIANDVAVDANRAEDAAQGVEDALDVVRAHRWVPQGEWSSGVAYSAGDVVAHDGGSYYAQADIAAGVEPPGGDWLVLGQGGITDAAELTGVLTEDVDASDVTVHLEKYFPGLESGPLADLIGNLILSADASVEASRITGALTDQVDASQAMVTGELDGTHTMTLAELVEGLLWFGMAGVFRDETTGYFALWSGMLVYNHPASGHTEIPIRDFAASVMDMLLQAQSDISDKADAEHTHTIDGIEAGGTRNASTYLNGAGQFSTPPNTNTTYAVPSQAEAQAGTATTARAFSAQRVRQAANAAFDARVQRVTQLPANPDPNVQYWVVP